MSREAMRPRPRDLATPLVLTPPLGPGHAPRSRSGPDPD